jgi:bifunctional N-acetylglucosamine-1-phosphate-uridyltransferase/glucosamine-1-phosphate-acetyltransferase GlmU-like protein
MNMWGFTPSFLDEIGNGFGAFLDNALANNPLKGEYYLPSVVQRLLKSGQARVKVLTSTDQWYGVTYAADKPVVVAALRAKAESGEYPDGLWN